MCPTVRVEPYGDMKLGASSPAFMLASGTSRSLPPEDIDRDPTPDIVRAPFKHGGGRR
jgi:hypothetical protein